MMGKYQVALQTFYRALSIKNKQPNNQKNNQSVASTLYNIGITY